MNALLFAYREVPQESTGFAPFELLYGRTVRGPMQILRELWTEEVESPEVRTSYQYVFELRERLEETLELAREGLESAQKKQKRYFDRKAKDRQFKVGDKVLLLRPTDQNKLLMQWRGPFIVESRVGLNDYRVMVRGKSKVYHANMLKKYVDREGVSSIAAGSIVASVINSAEDDDEDDEAVLLELRPGVSKESVADVQVASTLSEEQRDQMNELLERYSSVFTDQPGATSMIQHKIVLKSDQPVRIKAFPLPYSVRSDLNKDIAEMLEMGIIQESTSPYASPVVIVKKKDGSNRICVDYRNLNKITVADPEPMTTVHDLMQSIGSDARFFTKIDLSKGYWQIAVCADDIPKTAFVTPDGHYEFLRMPFGLINSGATLVRGLRQLLGDIEDVESYVDDILIHSESWSSHRVAVEKVLQRLREAGFTARPTKCVFGAETVDFVGHQLSSGLVGLQEDNVKKIAEANRPTTKKAVRSFLGLTGYYRDYIPNYSTIAAPLTDLTKKRMPNAIEWTDSQEKAFRTLKTRLTSMPILKLPDPEKTFWLRTDASDVGLGGVLLQEHNGVLFPVRYASRKLASREKKYSTMEKECLAIVWSVQKFRLYLYGNRFRLQTDHHPLSYLDQPKYLNDRVMRWALFLQSYDYVIEAIKGSDNGGADYMSRLTE